MRAAIINAPNEMVDDNIAVVLVLELSLLCPIRSVSLGELADRLDVLLSSTFDVVVIIEPNITLSVVFVDWSIVFDVASSVVVGDCAVMVCIPENDVLLTDAVVVLDELAVSVVGVVSNVLVKGFAGKLITEMRAKVNQG